MPAVRYRDYIWDVAGNTIPGVVVTVHDIATRVGGVPGTGNLVQVGLVPDLSQLANSVSTAPLNAEFPGLFEFWLPPGTYDLKYTLGIVSKVDRDRVLSDGSGTGGPVVLPLVGEWDEDANYTEGMLVTHPGGLYQATAPTLGDEPPADPWVQLAGNGRGIVSITALPSGDLEVVYDAPPSPVIVPTVLTAAIVAAQNHANAAAASAASANNSAVTAAGARDAAIAAQLLAEAARDIATAQAALAQASATAAANSAAAALVAQQLAEAARDVATAQAALAQAQAVLAQASATAAATSAAAALASELAAAASAVASAASQAAAAASELRAQQWAENPEDVAVVPGAFSALHWAAKAAASAATALEAALTASSILDQVQDIADELVPPAGASFGRNTGTAIPGDGARHTVPLDVEVFLDEDEWDFDAGNNRIVPLRTTDERVVAELSLTFAASPGGTFRRMDLLMRKPDGTVLLYPLTDRQGAPFSATEPVTLKIANTFPSAPDYTFELQASHDFTVLGVPQNINVTGAFLSIKRDIGRRGRDGILTVGDAPYQKVQVGDANNPAGGSVLTFDTLNIDIGTPVLLFRGTDFQEFDTFAVTGLGQITVGHVGGLIDGDVYTALVPTGTQGLPGIRGFHGWSPVLAAQVDDARRVLQVIDWTGGEGVKPATGLYVGLAGLVADIADGVDVRGPAGTGGSGVPAGGDVGQQLEKASNGDFDTVWASRIHVPGGGTLAQVLRKVSAAAGDTTWGDVLGTEAALAAALNADNTPSATRWSLVALTVEIVATASVAGGASGLVELCRDAGGGAAPTTVRTSCRSSFTITLGAGIGWSSAQRWTIWDVVPPGHVIRARTTGSATMTITQQRRWDI